MKLFLIVVLLVFSLGTYGCNGTEEAIEGFFEEEPLEEEQVLLGEDFTFEIGALPYRGAVLFIDYLGEVDISGYELRVDIALGDTVMQQDMLGEYVDGNLVAEIVDLMYFPGDELHFTLKVKEEGSQIFEYHYSEDFRRYPWKDWMLASGEWFSIELGGVGDNFVYGKPSWGGVGAHASWDIRTAPGASVYSGTVGIIFRAWLDSVEIFNPHTGALLQYGHVNPPGYFLLGRKTIVPGEYIGNVCSKERHIHYSVIRPYVLKKHPVEEIYWLHLGPQGGIYDLKYYKDPFYFHEPATMGYWNEETLPPGLKQKMLSKFQRYNPGIVLPAREPLE